MKPTKEQKKIFWEWGGFSTAIKQARHLVNDSLIGFPQYEYTNEVVVVYPDGLWSFDGNDYPSIDIKSIFKWIMPKLKMYELNRYNNGELHTAWVSLSEDGGWQAATSEDPALALFWAVYKIIEKESQ